MAKYSEETLSNYCSAVSDTEEKRIENAKTMIKSTINDGYELQGFDYEIFTQGSYENNTNIKADSDIDICVMLKGIFYGNYPYGLTGKDYGFPDSTMKYDDYKQRVSRALIKKFGTDINVGNKSIKIKSNSYRYRVNVDVVIAFQYRDYDKVHRMLNNRNLHQFIEGIKFFASDGNIVINYPKQHIENGISKDKNTSGLYKKLVRIENS